METQPRLHTSILIVDDEDAVLASVASVLRAAGIDRIVCCSDPRNVLNVVAEELPDAILLDISMPYISGDLLLEQIAQRYPEVPVIMITASDDIETAVRCLRAGAFDYMVKTVEPNRLVTGVKRAIKHRNMMREYDSLRSGMLSGELQHPDAFTRIVTRSPRMRALFLFVEAVAVSAGTVLIAGDTGTGKELIAEAIHTASNRPGSLVRVNIAGLNDTMISDTLFGHTPGAFTGAVGERKGIIAHAGEGTVFLDEIGDLSASSQIMLLRLLDSGEYFSLGSDLVRTTRARFVVATNRNLRDLVSTGAFRKDLYYRLKTHEARVPSLRERREDLLDLVEHFQTEASETMSKEKLAVPAELMSLLNAYDFPGNVRELRSMVYSAVTHQKSRMLPIAPFREAMGFAPGSERPPDTGETLRFPDRFPSIKETTEQLIAEAMRRADDNQATAAGLLGITPQALSKRLRNRAGM